MKLLWTSTSVVIHHRRKNQKTIEKHWHLSIFAKWHAKFWQIRKGNCGDRTNGISDSICFDQDWCNRLTMIYLDWFAIAIANLTCPRMNANLEISTQMRQPGRTGQSGPSAPRRVENEVLSLETPSIFPGPKLATSDHFWTRTNVWGFHRGWKLWGPAWMWRR